MKSRITRLLSAALLCCSCLGLQAQDSLSWVPYFSILSPAPLAGVYQYGEGVHGYAHFGAGVSQGNLVAELAIGTGLDSLMCDSTSASNFTGKIVLIRRSICEFGLKCLIAQQKGAVGVIIWNFDENLANMVGGAYGANVTIPSINIKQSLGAALEAALLGGQQVLVGFSDENISGFGALQGTVRADTDGNCLASTPEPGLKGWTIVAQGTAKQYTTRSQPNGAYSMFLDTVNTPYTLQLIPPNGLWEACPGIPPITVDSSQITQLDIDVSPLQACPALAASIGAPFLRRCFPNYFNVSVWNEGTAAANDAYAIVAMDVPGFESILNVSMPYTVVGAGQYRFELGTMAVGAVTNITFTANVSCDSTIIGQTLCYSVHAYPDTSCVAPSNWDRSTVSVTSACVNNQPKFTLKNIGTGPMIQAQEYVIIEDDVMYQSGQIQLNPGQSQTIDLPGNGSTWRVETTQSPNHPVGGNPAAFVEGCTPDGTFSTGFANAFSVYESSSAEDVECQEIIGSFDPNDKQGFPLGLTYQHLILPNTDLEYLIRFQNTGTDTAFTVVVRDSLPEQFEVSSVVPGAASAPYTFELVNRKVLVFRFDNIRLVDSFKNEALSHGYVRFKVSQKRNLPFGTEIFNSAAIFFDFNPPVITNKTHHKLGDVPHVSAVRDVRYSQLRPLTIFPNPMAPSSLLSFKETLPANASWRLFDQHGQLLQGGKIAQQQLRLAEKNLLPGVYWLEVFSGGKRFGGVKLLVH